MDKRLEKRQRRKVERAKLNLKISEPDVRTHEEMEAARQASQADGSRAGKAKLNRSPGSFRKGPSPTQATETKTEN